MCSCTGVVVPECNHWVTTSYHEGEVRLYDSKFNHVLIDSLKEQIAVIMEKPTGILFITKAITPFQGRHQFCLGR